MIKNTWNDVLSVLNFTCIFFNVAIIGGFLVTLAQGSSTLSLTFIGQLLVYTLILAAGGILCFTDLVIKTNSITIRIVSVGAAVYAVSLIYLSGCSFNPLSNPAIFMVYTVLFITIVFGVSQVFMMYQKYRESKYRAYIAQFQNKFNGNPEKN